MWGKNFALALWLAVLTASAQSPDGALQPPVKPNEEMVKWLETVDAQWQATFTQEVTTPFESEKAKLAQQYASGLEANLAKASAAGNLDATLLWRNERDRFASEKTIPAEDDTNAPDELKQLRAGWRTHSARLEKDRGVRAKSVHARYDQVLAQAQTQLTQKQRIEDAVMVKNKREETAARWQVQPPEPVAAVATPQPAPPPPKPPLGSPSVPALAKVEAQNVTLSPLAVGEKQFNDRDYRWAKVPPSFIGSQFTMSAAQNSYLRFKVLSDGLVHMACTVRFAASGGSGPWKSEITTEEQLGRKGWKAMRGVELKGPIEGDWRVFTRHCKAGEEFNYRTEKYVAPILLVR